MIEQIGKYMTAERQPDAPGHKTHRWTIRNNSGGVLGYVAWYAQWRQYEYKPNAGTGYSDVCLADLRAFVARRNAEQKAEGER